MNTVFSLSGNQIMPVYDACIDADIRIVHVRHEAAAVYMADAWAQLTGSPGVALLTAGPGFANGLSPLYSARQAESPVVLLSGDSPVAEDGNGAFQEMAQADMTRPIVKQAARVGIVGELPGMLKTAFDIALSGRRGPVHLALPFDVLNADEPKGEDFSSAGFKPAPQSLSPGVAERIADAVASASRPVILLGPQHNRSRSPSRVAALEQALGAPVVAMESPRGLRDPALGAFAEILASADLVVGLGKKFDFTLGFARSAILAPDADIIVVDPEPDAIEKARELAGDRILLSDAAAIADAIDEITALNPDGGSNARHDAWRAEVEEALALRLPLPAAGERIGPQQICETVNRFLAEAAEPILICDGGEFGQWAQAGCSAPVRIINGMSGAIGGGLCYALAAKLARPGSTVVALMGDGTAGFHFAEFDTAAREGADFLAVIGNDDCWNAEHQIQLRDYGPDRLIGCALSPDTRYDLAAAAFGGHGEHVTTAAELEPALLRAAASRRPACINVSMAGVAAPTVTRARAG
ncbi:MAG TPA: thiamine pyrophosphate-binding protein, partial [Afifellaceae bacterium]|nr:thiamine pyrophosphate-binding protein [Afifellaceae bacterium]